MAKVRFTNDMTRKPVTKTGDFLIVFDGEETNVTNQVKFTPDIPKIENDTQDIETGLLYNWYAVNTGKLAPTGYRVSSNEDFTTLVNYLISEGYNYDGTTSGNKLGKSVCIPFGWQESDTEGAVGNDDLSSKYNTTRFTMVNTKRRESNGSFDSAYEGSPVWTTTEAGSNAYYRHVGGGSVAAYNQNDGNKKSGYGVRCLRDATAGEQLLADGTFLEDVTDLSGNIYNTVKLGTQVWFRQHLKTTKYNDNTDITNVTDNTAWGSLTTGAYCTYNNEAMVVFEVEDYLYVKPKESKKIKAKNIYFDLVVFDGNTNIGNIATTYSFIPTTKINRATVTGNVVITLPTYPSTQSVSIILKITQGTGGGFDVTFADAVNLSQFVFTDGAGGQRTWVTLLWDGEEWCFTASAWKDAV